MLANNNKTLVLSSFDIQEILRHFGVDWIMRTLVERLRIAKIEIPFELLQKCFVCPDFIEQAIVEGECQQLEEKDIGAGLVEIVQNPDKYAYVQNERSVFDSTGWALEDKIVMDLFLDCALKLGLGQELEIEHRPNDTKNPYDFLKAENVRKGNTDSQIKKAVSLLSAQG